MNKIYDIIKMAIKTITSNKLRSGLSMLGIIIGVSTILLVIAIGKGAEYSIEQQYKNLSVTTIMVMPVNTANSQSKLSDKDINILLDNKKYIEQATPLLQGKLPISANGNSDQFTILGVKSNFPTISNLNLIKGTFFSEQDDKTKAKKIILGWGVFQSLFDGNLNILGETVIIGKKKFELIGIFEPSGTSVGPISYDDSVFIPYNTANKIILGSNGIVRLIVLAKDIDSIDLAMGEIGEKLRKNHKLKSSDPDDFRLRDQGSKVIAAKESAKTMSILLTVVATVVLIVSGIGIMNVMFAGVAERTKEIGILKAIGAKRLDILYQFLIESIILTMIAGFLGVIIGEILIPFLNGIDGFLLLRSNFGDILAFGFAILVGVFFGRYPAFIASKMDPVDAIRS